MALKFLNTTPATLFLKQKIEPTLFETIKIEDGKIYNLSYHQERVDTTFKELFNSTKSIELKNLIKNYPTKGLYRAKLIYNKDGLIDLNYYIYSRKTISNLMLIEMPNIDYRYKYLNRDFFTKLSSIYNSVDEFLITQNGFLKDTTIANIALFHKYKNIWHTPKEPLLFGTSLKRYLSSNKIKATNIHFKDLKNYSKIAFLNAMIDWQEQKIDI